MKLLILAPIALLVGCRSSGTIATIQHADGSGYTRYDYVAVGGGARPGTMIVVAQTVGSNAPVVLSNASGPPVVPAALGGAANIATGATLAGLWPDRDENVTTVIQGEPRAPMMEPPTRPPRPPARPPNSTWPPGHRPYSDRPHNRGH